jgi:hypothetical protein
VARSLSRPTSSIDKQLENIEDYSDDKGQNEQEMVEEIAESDIASRAPSDSQKLK